MAPPKNKAKQTAIQNGEKFYSTGKPCHQNHISRRFVSSGECEECYEAKYPGAGNGSRKVISKPRKYAIDNGLDTYSTGKPCRHGHISERFVSTHTCVECSRTIHNPAERIRYRNSKNTLEAQFRARRNQSLKKGIPFTITFEELEQPEFCPVLGLKLNYEWSGKNGGHLRDPSKATIDKVVPELGYVPGNVFVISWRANKLKSDMKLDELEKIMKYIKEKRNETI